MTNPEIGNRVIYRHAKTGEDYEGEVVRIHPGFKNPVDVKLDDEEILKLPVFAYYSEEPMNGRWRYAEKE